MYIYGWIVTVDINKAKHISRKSRHTTGCVLQTVHGHTDRWLNEKKSLDQANIARER